MATNSGTHPVHAAEDDAAYELLPAAIRSLLQAASVDYDCQQVLDAFLEYGQQAVVDTLLAT